MKRELRVVICQTDERVSIEVQLDGEDKFKDGNTFCDVLHASGNFADIFHFLTMNRFKLPSNPIPIMTELERRLGKG